MTRISITPEEVEQINNIAEEEYTQARKEKRAEAHGLDKEEGFNDDLSKARSVLGCKCEQVAAKALNLPRAKYTGPGSPDIGKTIQVRGIDSPKNNLLVRMQDFVDYREATPFVLIEKVDENTYDIHGWITLDEIRQMRMWWTHAGKSSRERILLVKKSSLHPIETLPKETDENQQL